MRELCTATAIALAAIAVPNNDEASAAQVDSNEADAVPVASASEARKLGLCLLEVDGETFVSGPCTYYGWEAGSFMFNGLRQVDEAADYSDPEVLTSNFTEKFVYVFHSPDDIDPESGQGWYASWNAELNSTKADSYLGPVKRDGACFTNERAKICLWES